MKRCFLFRDIESFRRNDNEDLLNEIVENHTSLLNLPLDGSQKLAWMDSIEILKDVLANESFKGDESVIFEYILPYESGRRPDVILLSNNIVYILEFKMKSSLIQADVDQLLAYTRDISEYHVESRELEVKPLLVLTQSNDFDFEVGSPESKYTIDVVSPNRLSSMLESNVGDNSISVDPEKWMNSAYEPLPTIVEAAKLIMKNEPLPNIRKANSTGIPESIDFLNRLVVKTEEQKEYVLAFVTGVPGSGKTLLGLQFVYDDRGQDKKLNSIYLSGNGPLIKVLSNALKSDVFVSDLHKVVSEYIRTGAHDFSRNVVVFDEGQRAWDEDRILNRYKIENMTEPKAMIQLMDSRLDWAMLLVLVGEGQEINTGENKGIMQWNDAIGESSKDWKVVCPEKIDNLFPDELLIKDKKRSNLDLTTSLRTHLSGDVSLFVNSIISEDIDKAKELYSKITNEGYTVYLTRDLEKAKQYCNDRYQDQVDKRYGLLASSKARGLAKYQIWNSFKATRYTDFGKWYNTPKGSGRSCCDFRDTVTEFGCQGLELDMPILCWGDDLLWNTNMGKWNLFDSRLDEHHEKNVYRYNSYRVLLSRGRDGLIIFFPTEEKYNGTCELFKTIGIKVM